jgi:hypothetical protein
MAFRLDSKQKKIALAVALVIGAYLAYRYLSGKKSGNSSALGTNLNSVPAELIGGSSGPDSGLNYYAGDTTVNVTEDITSSASSSQSSGSSSIASKTAPPAATGGKKLVSSGSPVKVPVPGSLPKVKIP